MDKRNRNRLALVLVALLFAAPLVVAAILTAVGWRPAGMRNHGELLEPPEDVSATRLALADGSAYPWKDAQWQFTLLALPGPDCGQHCLVKLDELMRARLTLNQNFDRLRVVAVDADLAATQTAALAPLELANDPDRRFAALHPTTPDSLAAALVDPNGRLILRYAVGYDANGLRKDLARIVH